jgi:lysophospholipase L1-like esterase
MHSSRRAFVAASAAARIRAPRAMARVARPRPRIILFQGDSITDVGRDRKQNDAGNRAGLGGGYPLLVAAALRERDAERDLQIFNRGVSGNTVPDLQARWQTDTLGLKPDLLSILIGVNDIWHTRTGDYHGTPEKYETEYEKLLTTTRAALPGVRLMILEPFVLRTGAVSDDWFPEFDRYRNAARRIAHGAHATFIPLHDMFQNLARKTGPAYWLADGVHPTLAGHEAIARRWLEGVKL